MRYETTLFQSGNNTGVPVPPEVLDALGGGRRPAVSVAVNGYAYRSTIASMSGQSLISFSSDKRAATGLRGGDAITVALELDTAPREVEVPADLSTALAEAGLTETFAALAPSHRKAHALAVSNAKAADTRARRVAAVVSKLSG